MSLWVIMSFDSSFHSFWVILWRFGALFWLDYIPVSHWLIVFPWCYWPPALAWIPFISCTLLALFFAFRTALCAEASSRCWKILVPIDTTASFSCCRCTSMMWSFLSTKSWGSTTGLSLGGCGGHLSLCDKVLSPAGSNHQKMVHCGYTGMDIVRFQTILCKHGDGCDNLNYSDQHPRHD